MNPKKDHGKARQALEESSLKRMCSSIDKGKAIQQNHPGVQYPHFATPLSISSSPSMLFEQQYPRPSSAFAYPMNTPLIRSRIDKGKGIMVATKHNDNQQHYPRFQSQYLATPLSTVSSPSMLFEQQNPRPLAFGYPMNTSEIHSSINKGKGIMVANNDHYIQQQYPGVQNQHFANPVSIVSSPSMLSEKQNQTPVLPLGNPSISSLVMSPPADEWKQVISDFIYENNFYPNAVKTPGFRGMINDGGRGPLLQSSIPTVSDLTNKLTELNTAYQKLQARAEYIKQEYWPLVGCSVILDEWVNEVNGRTFLNVLADCPLGTIYLQSLDVSQAVNRVEAMEMVVERVISDVGSEYVVQVVFNSASPLLNEVRKGVMERNKSIYWSVSATYCLSLMLERVASSISWVNDTIEKAKKVSRLIHSNPVLLDLSRKGSIGEDKDCYLVKPSKIKAATPFLTLENMLLRKKDIQAVFASQEWNNSCSGSTMRGTEVTKLVLRDKSFWTRLTNVVRGGMPIVNMLRLLNDGNCDVDRPLMGILYETMDQMKETIMDEIGKEKAQDIWDIIDVVWNHTLHSSLHAAGYYLNPKLFYSEDFVCDHEVLEGLNATILKLGGNLLSQSSINEQLNWYHDAKGDFKRGKIERNRHNPIKWWTRFGVNYPQLKTFALKILGLTCNGSSRYEFRRELAENLLSVRKTHPSYERIMMKCFVSYNLHLRKLNECCHKTDIKADELDPFDDWILGDY